MGQGDIYFMTPRTGRGAKNNDKGINLCCPVYTCLAAGGESVVEAGFRESRGSRQLVVTSIKIQTSLKDA